MRRGRRGRPHLLCPPCPPIGQSRGSGAESGPEAKSGGPGAGPVASRSEKAVRPRRGRCARLRACFSSLPRARRCHGRSAPALRTVSGTEERGHRRSRGPRSQDRCRKAVSRHGSSHPAKPVSSVRLRGLSTVQCHRICIPRICFSQSHREPKQGRRHCVANLLGGVRPVRSGGILQRSTPVLVPFLLRGQVRLPVVLHDAGTLERCAHVVPSRRTANIPKTSRGPRQRREPAKRKSSGHRNWDNPGRASGPVSGPGSHHSSVNNGAPASPGTEPQDKPEPTAEAEIKSPGSVCAVPQDDSNGHTPEAQASENSSDSNQPHQPSSPSVPTESPSRAMNEHSPSSANPGSASESHGQPATGSISGSQIPSKARRHRSRGSVASRTTQRARLPSASLGPSQVPMHSGGASHPAGRSLGPTRTTGRLSGTNHHTSQVSAPVQPAGQLAVSTPTPPSTQHVSPSNQDSPRARSPSTPPDPNQAGSKELSEPGDGGSKNSNQGQKILAMQGARSSPVTQVMMVPCHADSSLEFVSESTTEITCKWPGYSHQLRCPRHCWLLQHLAY